MSVLGRKNHERLTMEVMDEEMEPPRSNTRFYPASLLDELVCEDVVRKILSKRTNLGENHELVEFICEKARRIFAILISCDCLSLIAYFHLYQFTDSMLPVGPGILSGSLAMESFTSTFANVSIAKDTFDRNVWDYSALRQFHVSQQWPFISPIFSDDTFRYDFHEKTYMPFMEEHGKFPKCTLYSLVERRCIHRSHLRVGPAIGISRHRVNHPFVAVKEIKKGSLDWDTYKAVADEEAEALEMLRGRNHLHLLRAIGYYTIGKKRFILSPWASYGNLREFWEKTENHPSHDSLKPQFMCWMFNQLRGLAEAVERLHNVPGTKESWRHGDLKPENILCFSDIGSLNPEEYLPCILVIGDVGLTRHHTDATQERQHETRTKSGTIMYEPPETELDQNQKKGRSRRYDIWSMGCIYLEFIVWLLYGPMEMKRLIRDLGENKRFYELDSSKNARLHHVIRVWIDDMRSDDRCSDGTALRSLLDLVVEKLLNTDMGVTPTATRANTLLLHRASTLDRADGDTPDTPTVLVRAPTELGAVRNPFAPSFDGRASAEEMSRDLASIYNKGRQDKKWLNFDAPSRTGPEEHLYSTRLTESDAIRKSSLTALEREEYKFTPLDDTWKYEYDGETAHQVSTEPNLLGTVFDAKAESRLCERCQNLSLWSRVCDFSDTIVGLKEKGEHCALCRILLHGFGSGMLRDSQDIHFSRFGSSIICQEISGSPIASLYKAQEHQNALEGIHIGHPVLSQPGSKINVGILKAWLRLCDLDHTCLPKNDAFLPTRALDVGTGFLEHIRLVGFSRSSSTAGKYLALSHRWGATSSKFRTTTSNLEKFKEAIPFNWLPPNFQQAVEIARALDIRYLWIDSLCIVQDDQEDWNHESGLMEQVFSSAYATIAATCATEFNEGFLKHRPERQYITIDSGPAPFYVSEAIDNFQEHVEQAEINKRGWVLQERALSRRTIHFSDRQCYWECGDGIRCETFTKMKNRKASFLSDADFPKSVDRYVRGMKIELCQDLYSNYSQLGLSFQSDRPVAIRGLEKRLLHTLGTTGGFGVFEIYFHRSLLWRRANGTLKPIEKFRGSPIPSWSWMAYEGGITYMNVPGRGAEWNKDVESPFPHAVTDSPNLPEIRGPIHAILHREYLEVYFDEIGGNHEEPLSCLVVGTSVQRRLDEQPLCYVLLVTPLEESNPSVYRRVGVARMRKDQIDSSSPVAIGSIR